MNKDFKVNVFKPAILFFTAFVYRSIFGVIFLGGIDLRFYSYLSYGTIDNSLLTSCPYLNYFPLEAFYWWFAGWLMIHTSLPFAFCFKLFPIFFDALLAVLLYSILKRHHTRYAFFCGMLYALSPIAVIIDCMHCQWESVFLFFLLLSLHIRDFYRDSIKKYLWVGILFAVSFLSRTVSIAFLPFIFVPHQEVMRKLLAWLKPYKVRIFGGLLLGFILSCSFIIFFVTKMQNSSSNDFWVNIFGMFFSRKMLILACGCIVGLLLVIQWFLKKSSTTLSVFFKQKLREQLFLGGSIFLFSLGALLFFSVVMRIEIGFLINTILRCLNKGTQVMGLPYALPFSTCTLLKQLVTNRVWTLIFIGFLVVLYYQQRITSFCAISLSFMFMIGFLGISTSYLMWPVVMLLLEEMYGFAAFYNFVITCFLVLYYASPFSDGRPGLEYINITSFAVLKGFRWLMPPTFLLHEKVALIIRVLGNYVIPFSCVLFIGYLLSKIVRSKGVITAPVDEVRPRFYFFKNGFLLINVMVVGVILLAMLPTDWGYLTAQFEPIKTIKMQAYDLQFGGGLPPRGIYGNFSWFNIAFILLFIALAWSSFAWYMHNKRQTKQKQ